MRTKETILGLFYFGWMIASVIFAFTVIWWVMPILIGGAALFTGISILVGSGYYVLDVLNGRRA